MRTSALLATLLVLSLAAPASAEIVNRSADFDRWNYPFNGTPGTRTSSPVFGAVGEESFDDFDGQFLIGFNTATAGVPTSLPAGKSLKINSVTVTATHTAGSFIYDSTADAYTSYLDPSDPNYTADTDSGRPLELWGAGVRNGYTSLGFGATVPGGSVFEEGDIFGFGDPTTTGIRNAFAYDPNFGDVSNLIKNEYFSASPWAVGTTDSVAPGAAVLQGVPGKSAGSTFSFDLDLSRPEVLGYVLDGIADGGLFFTIASLYETEQGGSGNPNFFTRDSFDPAKIAPTITINFEVVPEPASMLTALVGMGLIGVGVARRASRRAS